MDYDPSFEEEPEAPVEIRVLDLEQEINLKVFSIIVNVIKFHPQKKLIILLLHILDHVHKCL